MVKNSKITIFFYQDVLYIRVVLNLKIVKIVSSMSASEETIVLSLYLT